MALLATFPLPVVLMLISAGLMLVPAFHGQATGDIASARAFVQSALVLATLAMMLGLARARPATAARDANRLHLRGLVLAYLVLPPLLALPMVERLDDLSWFDAWFEMVSALTTTGATTLPPDQVPGSVHLWRGLVGWGGGFLVLVAATGILAPLNLGGFEIHAPGSLGRPLRLPPGAGSRPDPVRVLQRHALAIAPAYGGITLALAMALSAAGDPALVAAMHAMAVLSTSGITPLTGLGAAPSGMVGELILMAGLVLALSRRLMPGAARFHDAPPLWRDPELRLAGVILIGLPLVLFLRHWLGPDESDPMAALRAIQGALFTVLSFLTTTGFESAGWGAMRDWSGMDAPGLILLGLTVIGGGIATTSGGVTLLRIAALSALVRREVDRLADPSSIGGGGTAARRLRSEGAFVAFVFFMLFAMTLGAMNLGLAALGLPFERALVLATSAVTGTGPLAETTRVIAPGWSDLGPAERMILAAGMVIGRIELLAILALLAPGRTARIAS